MCTFDAGAHIYREGEPGEHFYVLLDGDVRFTRRVGADIVELPETTQRGVYAGAEIEEATSRISTLVTAVKQYSHMDRAPFSDVDVTPGSTAH